MKKTILALTATAAMIGFATTSFAADKLKVCFLYVGSKTDGGWTQAHELGRQELIKAMGDKITTEALENVPEGPDAERAASWTRRSKSPQNSRT